MKLRDIKPQIKYRVTRPDKNRFLILGDIVKKRPGGQLLVQFNTFTKTYCNIDRWKHIDAEVEPIGEGT